VDEAPMKSKLAFEALDRTLRDLTGNSQPMGGMCMLLCEDFRQILPVIHYKITVQQKMLEEKGCW